MYQLHGLGLVSETCKGAYRNCTCRFPELKEEICLKVKTNKKPEMGLTSRVPSLLGLLGNKKEPQLSGKPALVARFAFQELHFQILHQQRWERRS